MKKITKGLLVILEGGEGAGKTSQAKKLVEYYNDKGYNTKYFREPGGNEIAENIRNMILYNEMDPTTEILLMNAARNININNNLLPALNDGCLVILDRFAKSTKVYQGILKNGNMKFIEQCESMVKKPIIDSSYILEFTLLCDPKVAIERAAAEGHERNKHDVLPIEDYKKINDAYSRLYIQDVNTIGAVHSMIDTTNMDMEKVFKRLVGTIDNVIALRGTVEEYYG